MKVNSFFCGAGGFDLGFIQAGFEIAGAWDFDKYAVESYKHNIGEHVEQADVSKMTGVDVPKANGWTFGFPCQDISVAGKQAGMVKGETRSGLFYEIMRLLDEVEDKPEWILAENVKAVKKFIPAIEEEYKQAGYILVPQLYNSKYWGVPQNRERYFLLGIRKDLNKSFVFPEQQTSFIPKLSSILEQNVDEKYYIDDLKAAKIIEQAVNGLKVKQATKKGYDIAVEGDSINISHPNSQTRRGRVGKQVAQTLLTGTEQVVVETLGSVHACITPDRVDKRQNGRRAKEEEEEMFTITAQDLHGIIQAEPKIEMIGLLDMKGNETVRRVYDPEGLAPTLTTSEGGHRQPKIIEPVIVKADLLTRSNPQRQFGFSQEACFTLRTSVLHGAIVGYPNYRVRKLTPREYARLQGFPDSYEQIVSNSQFYKQMGNAVTRNVAYSIAKAIKEQL